MTDTTIQTASTLADLRREYSQASLSESDILPDPFDQFGLWFQQALAAQVADANAMSLATVDAAGRPSSRILLLKDVDRRGFTWFTNYQSRKGCDLAANAQVAMLFYWSVLERQVRIEGPASRLPEAENQAYFDSRPLGSRQAALASDQSRPVASREEMEARLAGIVARHGDHPPCPPHWGGYRLVPERIEFWQGRPSRFHDRIQFTRGEGGDWLTERLQP